MKYKIIFLMSLILAGGKAWAQQSTHQQIETLLDVLTYGVEDHHSANSPTQAEEVAYGESAARVYYAELTIVEHIYDQLSIGRGSNFSRIGALQNPVRAIEKLQDIQDVRLPDAWKSLDATIMAFFADRNPTTHQNLNASVQLLKVHVLQKTLELSFALDHSGTSSEIIMLEPLAKLLYRFAKLAQMVETNKLSFDAADLNYYINQLHTSYVNEVQPNLGIYYIELDRLVNQTMDGYASLRGLQKPSEQTLKDFLVKFEEAYFEAFTEVSLLMNLTPEQQVQVIRDLQYIDLKQPLVGEWNVATDQQAKVQRKGYHSLARLLRLTFDVPIEGSYSLAQASLGRLNIVNAILLRRLPNRAYEAKGYERFQQEMDRIKGTEQRRAYALAQRVFEAFKSVSAK